MVVGDEVEKSVAEKNAVTNPVLVKGAENTLPLSTLELEIDFKRIYYRVDFE